MPTPRTESAPIEERAGPAGEIAVTRMGSGPALVLIHGLNLGRWHWDSVAGELAVEYELLIVDLRGHGSSYKPERAYRLEDYANDIDLVLGHYRLDRPLIVAHSLGGMIALEWAISNPDRARALVLEDTPLRLGVSGTAESLQTWSDLRRLPLEELIVEYRARFDHYSESEARERAISLSSVAPAVHPELSDQVMSYGGELVADRYREITSPALLIYAEPELGGLVERDAADAFVEALPNGEAIHVVSGHGLHIDRPAEFLAAALPFLRRFTG